MTKNIVNLPVQELEFEGIRKQFTEFLKADPAYKDFNFEASGISTQLNLLSYNTHMIGYYVKMLLDESFIDSAHTREALLSHAKKTNYTPKGKRSARAEIELKITIDVDQQPVSDSILIPKGTSFSSSNVLQDTRLFQLADDVVARDKTVNGNKLTYSTGTITVYEGLSQNWRFLVDSSIINQKFVIKDKTIDIDTLRVFIRPNKTSNLITEFKPVRFMDNIDGESNVYYVTTNENGFYQLFFGNNIFGVQPDNGNQIEVSYVSTNGETGNGAKVFRFNAPAADLSMDYFVGNFEDFSVITHSVSSGGMEEESIDSLKMTIPSHYRRQNRLVTVSDYKGIFIEEFRNIDSMNVWGGEDNIYKDYGKVYCSLKPKNAVALSSAAKDSIRDKIINVFNVVGGDIVFVDPEYVDVKLTISVDYDKSNTDKLQGEIKADVVSRVTAYNNAKLNKFDQILSDNDMINTIRNNEKWFRSIFTRKVLSKEVTTLYRSSGIITVNFSNSIMGSDIRSESFSYGGKLYHYEWKSDGMWLVDSQTGVNFLKDKSGNVDLAKGVIHFQFPEYASPIGYEKRNGRLKWFATPEYPDIYTSLNNIVRIVETNVEFRK